MEDLNSYSGLPANPKKQNGLIGNADLANILMALLNKEAPATYFKTFASILNSQPNTIYNLGALSILGQSPFLNPSSANRLPTIEVYGINGSGIFVEASSNAVDWNLATQYGIVAGGSTNGTLTGGITANGVYFANVLNYLPYLRIRTGNAFVTAIEIRVSCYV
jgi:hypothetical protein